MAMESEVKSKSIAAQLVSKLGSKDGVERDGDDGIHTDEEEYGAGLDAAAEDAMKAVAKNDPKAFRAALHSFLDQCK